MPVGAGNTGDGQNPQGRCSVPGFILPFHPGSADVVKVQLCCRFTRAAEN